MNSSKPTGGSELNFSDVLDVIEHDPDYVGVKAEQGATEESDKSTKTESTMMNRMHNAHTTSDVRQKPYVVIIEQPASKALRFRYECEGRSAGSIPGANSTTENKTFPTIQVVGYRGKAVVVVSCVTKDPPYRPHPHSLVGKDGCKKGVCTLEINNENMICAFSNLGIQCVKKKGIEEALTLRESIRVDPFQTGFAYKSQPQTIDLNAVRLCFQVFLEGPQSGKFTHALKAVVSEPIYDKKAMFDLTICKLSDCSSPVSGGKEIILLCDKVTRDDIQIVFTHEEDGKVVWEAYGEFSAADVHKQVAISFRTPPYKKLDIADPIEVYVHLRRPSDHATSEPRTFKYLPSESDDLKRKRQRLLNQGHARDFYKDMLGYLPQNPVDLPKNIVDHSNSINVGAVPRRTRNAPVPEVKREPIDIPDQGNNQGYPFENYNLLNVDPSYQASSVSPAHSPFPNYNFTLSPNYQPQLPVQSPNPLGGYSNQPKTVNIMDLDNRNILPQEQQPVNDLSGISFPHSDVNVEHMTLHMLSNMSQLSIHEADEGEENARTEQAQSELPVLTFHSGMMANSADLDAFTRNNAP